VRRAAPAARIVAVRAGPAAAVLPETIPPGPIVVLGLCGALRGLRVGASVVYRDVVDEQGTYTFDAPAVAALHAALPAAMLVRACTVDRVATRATERAALAAAYGADVVDMEGTHLSRALAARGRTCVVVRVVSDDPSYDLPPIEDAFDTNGAIRPLHLARAFAANPRSAARFIRDVRRALSALGAAAATIASR
jgi:hypothetical protein